MHIGGPIDGQNQSNDCKTLIDFVRLAFRITEVNGSLSKMFMTSKINRIH